MFQEKCTEWIIRLGDCRMFLHGERAWYMNSENTSRLLGIMYCGAYAHRADGSEDASIYVAYNFHWEDRILRFLIWQDTEMEESD